MGEHHSLSVHNRCPKSIFSRVKRNQEIAGKEIKGPERPGTNRRFLKDLFCSPHPHPSLLMLSEDSRCSGVKRKGGPMPKVTPDQSEPMVWECLDGSMISRCLMGRTHAQNSHHPSHSRAAPGACSHLPSTQCALRRHEVPSTGYTACLASQVAG